jgi:hypothetical protein
MISLDAQRHLRRAAGRVGTAFAFGAAIATPATWIGTRDLESYEHVFFSLDRGTAARAIEVLGHPVYTLAVGLGVRLPLQGNLGASPAALAAPYVPPAVTYWLLLTITIALVVLLIRRALEPLGQPWIAWAAATVIFCSVPMVGYAFYGDWPEVVVTYCAFVGGIFAPHALLAWRDSASSRARRGIATVVTAGTVAALVAVSHPGYWPLVAMSLIASALVTMCRTEYPLGTRIRVIAVLAVAACAAVAPQVPDIMRELTIADTDGMRRTLHGPGRRFFTVNLFPFRDVEREDPEMPFGLSTLALVALVIGLTAASGHARRVIVASALTSLALAVASATMSPGSSLLAPSSIWAIRDPATIFAVMAAAYAAGALVSAEGRAGRKRIAGLALLIAGLQGPAYATSQVHRDFPDLAEHRAWTRNAWPPEERATRRGLTREGVTPGQRLVFWPGVRDAMRNERLSSTDFADAGYLLVNAWTKHRTMRGVVEPNDILFNQVIELSADVLCDPTAVQFLQLRYLLRPTDVASCPPWTPAGGAEVDGSLAVDVNEETDNRAYAVASESVRGPAGQQPALSAGSSLLPLLAPLDGTALTIAPTDLTLRLDAAIPADQLVVLPVAYDEAWQSSSGDIQKVGGLLALSGATGSFVTMRFAPDVPSILRALTMTMAQLFALAGIVFLALADDRRVAGRAH